MWQHCSTKMLFSICQTNAVHFFYSCIFLLKLPKESFRNQTNSCPYVTLADWKRLNFDKKNHSEKWEVVIVFLILNLLILQGQEWSKISCKCTVLQNTVSDDHNWKSIISCTDFFLILLKLTYLISNLPGLQFKLTNQKSLV